VFRIVVANLEGDGRTKASKKAGLQGAGGGQKTSGRRR